jgi:lysyl endopeptidase
MGWTSEISRRVSVVSLAALLAAGSAVIVGAGPAFAAGRDAVEVPSAVVTDGLTVDQELQRQAELSSVLLRSMPRAELVKQIRVPVTPDELAAIDQVDRSTTPLKIGFVKTLAPVFNVSRLGRDIVTSGDGSLAWAAVIRADQGGAIRLHIENLNLPAGTELYVYSRAGEAFGPYTGTGPDATGDFWTTALFGSEAILQLRGSGSAADTSLRGASFRVTEVGIISPSFTGPTPDAVAAAFCGNPTCIVDASCYSAANSIKDAYAKMEWVSGAFLYTCTAGALNDTGTVGTAPFYALSANHCFSKNTTAKNVTFYWRFRTSACNGACPSNTGWPYKTTGSSVAATGTKGDFLLLQLNSAPPAGTTLLGFTNAAVANTNGVALHRVSNPNFGPQVYNEQTVNTSAPTCRSWPRGERIYSRDTLGGTDGGSSGSPVVNSSDQVVGQLSGACGTNTADPCDSTKNATVDGALAYYWLTVKPFINP